MTTLSTFSPRELYSYKKVKNLYESNISESKGRGAPPQTADASKLSGGSPKAPRFGWTASNFKKQSNQALISDRQDKEVTSEMESFELETNKMINDVFF